MRLIDENSVIETAEKFNFTNENERRKYLDFVRYCVQNSKTAYDAENVLKQFKEAETDVSNLGTYAIPTDEAIKIALKGGINGETELKPCPFCGGKATLRKSEETKLYHIACFECGCRQDSSYKAEAVINAWNTRKPMDDIVAKMEAEQEKLETDMWAKESNNWYGQYCNGMSEGFENAIDIVKRGGME